MPSELIVELLPTSECLWMFLVCCPSDWVMLYEKISAKRILHALMLIPEIVSLVFLYCSRRRQSNVEPNKVRSLCSTDSFHISFLYAPEGFASCAMA